MLGPCPHELFWWHVQRQVNAKKRPESWKIGCGCCSRFPEHHYIYKDVQLKHPVKTGTLFFFFFWLVLEKRTLRSTRTPLKQLLTFFQLVQYTKTSPNGCNGWLFCVRVSQQGEAIRLLQGVLEPEEELGCHLGFFQRLTMLGCQCIIKHVNVIW